jgi:hypothetical protein
MNKNPAHSYTLNKNYGRGRYRRRILLENFVGEVHGALEDTHHGFKVVLGHDGQKIVSVSGEPMRIPYTTCGGAIDMLQRLQGCSLQMNYLQLQQHAVARDNCTHWLDLAALAAVHVSRTQSVRQYDVEITDDAGDDEQQLRAWCNAVLIHNWKMQRLVLISAPAALVGQGLMKGFGAAAALAFAHDHDALEAALVLQEAAVVAQGRRWDLQQHTGEPPSTYESRRGVCYSYSPEHSDTARRTENSVRDFSDRPEFLLKFI